MSNLITLQRDYLLGILNEVQCEHNLKFLVIDEEVEKLLTFLFRNPNELLAHVTAVDRIDSPKRKGQTSVDVVYLVRPSKFNINCMDADFSNRPPKYKRAHVRFLPGFESYLVEFFHSKRYISQYLFSLAEAKLAFIPKEDQFFQTMGIDRPLQIFFNKNCGDLINKNIKKTIASLLNLCIVTGEYPIVRYSQPMQNQVDISSATLLARKLAVEFQQALDNYARDHQDFPPAQNRPRSVFLITDRTLDLFAPILHDFTYQAMAYDLVPDIDPSTNMYHYTAENEKGEQEEKTSKLTDLLDPDWVELKHLHIVDASEYLSGKLKEIIAKNPLLVDRSNVKNTTDLLSVVAHLKDFDEERRRLILHRTLIDSCLNINQERKLAELADLEQVLCGFGLTMDGEKYKNITDQLLHDLVNKQADLTDKVRCIITYALYRGGLIEEDFVKLLAFIGVDSEHEYYKHFIQLFQNFDLLGFKLIKEQPKMKPFKKEWLHDTILNDSTVYNTSRFIPAAGNAISKVITNPLLLSEEYFPYVKDKPIELLDEEEMEAVGANSLAQASSSLRNPRHKAVWTKNNSSGSNIQNRSPRQRFFYYIVGGVTYSEIKSIYDQSNLKNKDVFIGSDGLVTPLAFMKSIELLTSPREMLTLQDDVKEVEKAPDYLYNDSVARPVSHLHIRSQNAPQSAPTPAVSKPQDVELKETKKKKSKFAKFLRSKGK